jgi:uncharacterized protein
MKQTLTKRCFRILCLGLLGCLTLLTCCQSKLIYFPRPYGGNQVAAWQQETQGQVVRYETSSGPQTAFLQRKVRQAGLPERLWIVGAGNGSLALDLADWFWKFGDARDAFLLVDYPGYGQCAGSPSPHKIKANFQAALPAAATLLGHSVSDLQPRLRLFGHSLGCAAVLTSAKELGIQRGVLVAPFTSTMDMANHVTRLPVGFLVWHRFDNLARLKEFTSPETKFMIVHGDQDEVIPVRMGREIHQALPQQTRLEEIPGGRHNDLFSVAAPALIRAMESAR